jgi:DNA polymerase (family 10)
MTEEELLREHDEIRALNAHSRGVSLLCGVEVDIRVNRRLDCSDAFLERCDIVVASVHSAFQRSQAEQTARLIAAMEHPSVDIVAHPTGRKIGKREGYEIDLGAVIDAAIRTGTALEVSAQPDRLDLNDDAVREAVKRGVMLAIDTDAHHANQLELMHFGVATARRGWAPPHLILNAKPREELLRWLQERRTRALAQP